MLPRIERYGGEVMQTSLDEESEARLREALEAPPGGECRDLAAAQLRKGRLPDECAGRHSGAFRVS